LTHCLWALDASLKHGMDLASTKGGIQYRQEASTGQTATVLVAASGDQGNE